MWKPAAALALLSLVPCFWLPRIVAGDLGSHVYGVWLTQLTEQGRAPGLYIATQFTNVLFDLVLYRAIAWLGFDHGTRAAVALAVLIFVSGAFCFIRRAGVPSAWFLAPALLVFAYGWSFHFGFFNFYLARGWSFMPSPGPGTTHRAGLSFRCRCSPLPGWPIHSRRPGEPAIWPMSGSPAG